MLRQPGKLRLWAIVEPLEQRQLLAGIQGWVVRDDPGEGLKKFTKGREGAKE